MTATNVRRFLRDINHYSKNPWCPDARSRALKCTAQEFLKGAEKDRSISWTAGWLRALAELHADEWYHVFEDVHPNMRPPLTMRQHQWDEYTGGPFTARPNRASFAFPA